ncbi:MAG: response regulator, partial [Chloroflexi bacterium CFX1]|nr:response regulator [Chloroflexi bacterium CFX1]
MVAGNSAERQNEPHHVLIISQNAGMARVWKALFEQKNCRVVCATSPQEGISSSHTISPALILL